MKYKMTIILMIILCAFVSTRAQVADNPPYTLEQSVIAGGGGTSVDAGNVYSITGAIGQAVVDMSSASAYSVKSGFFTAAPLAPTAAAVSVSGKIVTFEGRGLRNASVVLTDPQGNKRTVRSSAFGYFQFTEVEAGQTYVLTVMSKRYQFAPLILTVLEDADNLVLTAQPLIFKIKDY